MSEMATIFAQIRQRGYRTPYINNNLSLLIDSLKGAPAPLGGGGVQGDNDLLSHGGTNSES